MEKHKTPKEMEADYQLGLHLQEIGYIRKDWYVPPEKLYGASLINGPRNKSK